MARQATETIRVPAYQGRAFSVPRGHYLVVVDVEGMQIGDLVLLAADGPHERLSTSLTRLRAGRLRIRRGDVLYGTGGRSLATIVGDDNGDHDAVSHPCDRARYELDFHAPGHANCTDNLVSALAPWGVEQWWLPDPFNVFMRTTFMPDGRYCTEIPSSRPGDRFTIRAELDLIGAISACPQDMYPANGYRITDLELEVWPEAPPGADR